MPKRLQWKSLRSIQIELFESFQGRGDVQPNWKLGTKEQSFAILGFQVIWEAQESWSVWKWENQVDISEQFSCKINGLDAG